MVIVIIAFVLIIAALIAVLCGWGKEIDHGKDDR